MKFFFSKIYPTTTIIDVGSSKISCWVGRNNGQTPLTILGSSHGATQGVFGNKILDMEKMENMFRRILYEAERVSDYRIRDVTLVLSGAFFSSQRHSASWSSPENVMFTTEHVAALAQSLPLHYYPIHTIPLEFWVDGQGGIENPVGIIGKKLEAFFHVVGMPEGKLRSIFSCLQRCNITVQSVLCSGYSSALACLTPDEQILGATLLDFGESGTSYTSFFRNQWVDFQWIPLGGRHITQDITRGCETSLQYAEKLKVLYGSALSSHRDHQEVIPLVLLGEEKSSHVAQMTRAFLINVIRARVQEILFYLKPKLLALKKQYPFAAQRFILTGGGAQLPGIRDMVQQMFPGQVRLATPPLLSHAPYDSPAFSSTIGAFFAAPLPAPLQVATAS